MKSESKYTSFIVQSVENWLANLPSKMVAATKQESQLAIYHVTEALGYGKPFDREQKAINALLVDKWADEAACKMVWDFYHELRFTDFSDDKWKNKPEDSASNISPNIPPF